MSVKNEQIVAEMEQIGCYNLKDDIIVKILDLCMFLSKDAEAIANEWCAFAHTKGYDLAPTVAGLEELEKELNNKKVNVRSLMKTPKQNKMVPQIYNTNTLDTSNLLDAYLGSTPKIKMADVTSTKIHLCETIDCGKESKLRCPTCIKNGIAGSFFCSQECFKSNWDVHKLVHRKAKEAMIPVYQPWPGYKFTGKLRPFPVTPKRPVPDVIKRPDYADHPKGYPLSEQAVKGSTEIKVLNDEEIEAMRVVGKLARECLDVAADAIAVGVTTDEVDRLVHEAAIERDCYPSPLNYYCFPKSCCTSVNEVICHGIPDLRPLEDGDLLNVDITVYHNGFHGDLNETFFVGNVSDQYKKLVEVTYECLSKAIDIVHPGVKYREIGGVIQKIAQSHGYSVVRSYCGHGIHRLFHTAPNVPHYAKNKAVGIMKAGHTFTIEPMISEGSMRDEVWPDDWTAVTQDGKRSAQFEQTLLVTDTGVEILTRRRKNNGQPYFMDKTS